MGIFKESNNVVELVLLIPGMKLLFECKWLFMQLVWEGERKCLVLELER